MVIRVKSHRAREKMFRVTGIMRSLFSFFFDGEFYWVPDGQAAELLKIKGVTRARVDESKLRKCWSWN